MGLAEDLMNPFKDGCCFEQDFVVPETQHPKPRFYQKTVPLNVAGSVEVLSPVRFNDELGLETYKVEDEVGIGVLTAEFPAAHLSTAQMPPEGFLGVSGGIAQ
jgi:hypothetical protein